MRAPNMHSFSDGYRMRPLRLPKLVNLLSGRNTKMVCHSAGSFPGRPCTRLILVMLLLAVTLLHSGTTASSERIPERLIAVGDVHGAFDDFCLILRRAGLVNDQNHWIGGKAVLVQPGDLIDRGPKGREAMDLVMGLKNEAAKAGGQVVPLLGNHEVMNILGDLRYVPPQSYASFAENDSEKRRQAAYQEYAAWYDAHAKLLAGLKQPALPATKEEWMAKHPPGFIEYREAFSPEGIYGNWIRHHATVVKIGGILFVHGGISPTVATLSLEQINSQVKDELAEFDKAKQELVSRKAILPFFTLQEIAVAAQAELLAERAPGAKPDAAYHNLLVRLLGFNDWLCMRDDGPLWFRGYDSWSEDEGTPQIQKILAAYNAAHIVVAHTVQKTPHIRSRFEGRVFLIDTGMLSTYWPGGRASALEIRAGKFTALYLDGQEVLLEDKPAASAGNVN
jgi:calcineurin-like phosphoesterase family protein